MSQVRLDVWLDVACLFRTRSEAQKACKGGKVDVSGQTAKPHREIRVGDEIRITRPAGRRQTIVVRGLAERHVSRTLARELYTDTTPPLSTEEIELRRLERVFRASTQAHPGRSPDKRQRRALRRLRGH
jgi:ribosome-associated heat shock protein Hsp15